MRHKAESSPWTVIVIGTKWGTLSFQVARTVLVASCAIGALCIALALYALVALADTFGKHDPKDSSRLLQEARVELESIRKENLKLREKLHTYDNQFIATNQKTPLPQGNEKNITPALPVKPYEVMLDKLTLRHHPQDASCHFQFVLRATGVKTAKASGYIFVILRSQVSGQEYGLSYPTAELRSRKPVNFKQGDHFSVTSHKTIKGLIKKVPDPGIYSSVDILVYSDDGMLLFEKNYDLKGILSPS